MGAEIEKFQKEIEKANVEKIKAVDWTEKKRMQSRRFAFCLLVVYFLFTSFLLFCLLF